MAIIWPMGYNVVGDFEGDSLDIVGMRPAEDGSLGGDCDSYCDCSFDKAGYFDCCCSLI